MVSKDDVVKEYDKLYKANPTKWHGTERSEFAVDVIKQFIPSPKTIIDIGCGIGAALETIRKRFPDAELYGIDPSEEAIKLAKTRTPDCEFTTSFLDELKSKKKYDVVLCLGVAEHVEQLPEFITELKSLIKKDGILYFEVPHNLLYSRGPENFRRLTVGSRQMEWHFQLKTWEKKLTDAGLEIVKRYRGKQMSWEFIWVLKCRTEAKSSEHTYTSITQK